MTAVKKGGLFIRIKIIKEKGAQIISLNNFALYLINF